MSIEIKHPSAMTDAELDAHLANLYARANGKATTTRFIALEESLREAEAELCHRAGYMLRDTEGE